MSSAVLLCDDGGINHLQWIQWFQNRTAAASDPTVRVVVIAAEGTMFTAGNDLAEFAAFGRKNGPSERHVGRYLAALASFPKPVVAAVQGKAVGVGTTMLLHCDHVVLAADAELTTPFVNLALVPEAASSVLLPDRIGYLRAFEMFASGAPIAAEQALAWGLANRVVDQAELLGTAIATAESLAAKPAGSLTATKRLMRSGDRIAAAMAAERIEFTERLQSGEAKEAFAAFMERRAPNFQAVGNGAAV